MGAPQTPRRPVFFWQAVFILLPVAGLALFGLYSLRQDRVLAEQEARESGKILAQRLAEAISVEGAKQLTDYCSASFQLQANWTADLGWSTWGGDPSREITAWQNVRAWEHAHEDINLTGAPPAAGFMKPEAESLLPHPPAWFLQLTPQQRELWETISAQVFATGTISNAQPAVEQFKATNPSEDAQAGLDNFLMLAKTRGLSSTQADAVMANSSWRPDQITEAGLPVGQLIYYRKVRAMPDGAGISEKLMRLSAWAIYYRPSLLSPSLIGQLQRVAHGTGSFTNVATLANWWVTTRAQRQVEDDFREQYPTNLWATAPFWVNSSGGIYLLMLDSSRPRADDNRVPQNYLLFPEDMVNHALDISLTKAGASFPSYLLLEFEMAGRKIALPGNEIPKDTGLAVLGEADGAWENLPNHTNAYSFRIRALLASPQQLYARQRQRTWIFSALILVSAGAAMMGLFAAWRSFRRQRELNELKSNFVSSVSHELRAPIASVRLMAENLEHGKVPEAERQNEYFRFIVQECRRLSSLIENVLDFSRIEQGRKQYEFEPTDLRALIRTTVQLMEPYAAEKGVRVELLADNAMENLELKVDGRAIQQALVNLIDNAIKHSAKGQAVEIKNEKLKIKKDDGAQTAAICLSVTDHGPGIPVGEQEKIFERFYRLGSELRRETQGVGIGLSVVKHIVEAHGGRVTVRSEPGRGSCFTIELPVKN